MARIPIWADKLPSGAVTFGYSDGTTQDAPLSDYTTQLAASLPPRNAGALAAAPVVTSVATDATMGGAMGGPGAASYEMPSNAGAGGAPIAANDYGTADAAARAEFEAKAGGPNPFPPGSPEAKERDARISSDYRQSVSGANGVAIQGPARSGALADVAAALRARMTAQQPAAPAEAAPTPEPVRPRFLPSSPGRLIPGQLQTQQVTRQRTEYPSEMGSELELARDAGRDAQEMRIQNAQKADAAVELQRRATASATAFEENKALREDAKRRAQEAETAAKVEEVGKLAPNPEQFWQSRSGFQKAMLGLSVALGGYSAGRKGTPNQARAALDKAIADDIALQKETIGAKRTNAVNVLAEMRKRFTDERQAEQASIATMQKQAARTIEGLAYQAKDADNAAKLSEIAAKYHADSAASIAELGGTQVSETQVRTKDQVVGGGGGGLANPGQVYQDLLRQGWSPDQAAARMRTAYGISAQTASRLELAAGPTSAPAKSIEVGADPSSYIRQFGGFAATPAEAAKLRTAADTVETVRMGFNRIKELRRQGPDMLGRNKAAANSILNGLMDEINSLSNQGVINAGDGDRVMSQLPVGAGEWSTTDGTYESRLAVAEGLIDDRVNSFQRVHITPGRVYQTPRGTLAGEFSGLPGAAGESSKAADAAFTPAGGGK